MCWGGLLWRNELPTCAVCNPVSCLRRSVPCRCAAVSPPYGLSQHIVSKYFVLLQHSFSRVTVIALYFRSKNGDMPSLGTAADPSYTAK